MNYKSFLKSMLGFSALSWLQALISLLSIPLATRLLSTETVGRVSFFSTVLSLTVIVAGLSMEQSYIRFYSSQTSDRAVAGLRTRCLLLLLPPFLVVSAILFFFRAPLSQLAFDGDFPLAVGVCLPLLILCSILHNFQSSTFRMGENVRWYIVAGLGSIFALKLSYLAASFFTDSFEIFTAVMMLSYLLCVALVFLCKRRLFAPAPPAASETSKTALLLYSLPWVPSALMSYLNTTAVSYLVKDALEYATLGVYSTAVSISNVLTVFQSGFAIYWPAFMYKYYETEKEKIKKIHSFVSFGMSAVCIGVMLFSKILFLIVGRDFRAGSGIVGVLVFTPLVYMIGETTCYGIYLKKKTHHLLYITAAVLVTGVGLSYFLIPLLGLFGAALAGACSSLVFFVLRTAVGQHYYRSVEKFYRTVLCLAVTFGCGCANYFFENNEPLRLAFLLLGFAFICILYLPEIGMLCRAVKAALATRKKAR